jgi:hypothetical protein
VIDAAIDEKCEPLRKVEYETVGTVAVAAKVVTDDRNRNKNRTRWATLCLRQLLAPAVYAESKANVA